MKYSPQNKKIAGFTLIEMIISLALFTVVSTITVGALLSLIGSNQRLVKQQTITSSAIFSFDNMTREIRTGNYYYCSGGVFNNQNSLANNVRECTNGATGLSFIENSTRSTSGGRVAYYFSSNSLWRRIGNNPPEKLLPDDIVLDTSRSRFFVTGTNTLTTSNDTNQPAVTVIMVLEETEEVSSVTIQTTVTQRSLDI